MHRLTAVTLPSEAGTIVYQRFPYPESLSTVQPELVLSVLICSAIW